MNKDELMKFFDLNNDIEYYILQNHAHELCYDEEISSTQIAKHFKMSRQNINRIIQTLKVKVKLGYKINFFVSYVTLVGKPFYEKEMMYFFMLYEGYLKSKYEEVDWDKESIIGLNVNKKIYDVLKNKHKINTLTNFANLMLERLDSKNKKIKGLGFENNKKLIECFKMLLAAKFKLKNEDDMVGVLSRSVIRTLIR